MKYINTIFYFAELFHLNMGDTGPPYNEYHITLRGTDNRTYAGTFVLGNWSFLSNSFLPDSRADAGSQQRIVEDDLQAVTSGPSDDEEEYDKQGATYFVIAVLCIYSMSIMMLMLSHVGQRSMKIVEDKQIKKYLLDFQVRMIVLLQEQIYICIMVTYVDYSAPFYY